MAVTVTVIIAGVGAIRRWMRVGVVATVGSSSVGRRWGWSRRLVIHSITTPHFRLSIREPLLSISSITATGLRRNLRELDSDDMGEGPLDATDGRRGRARRSRSVSTAARQHDVGE